MERSTLSRLLLAIGVFAIAWVIFGKSCNKDKGANNVAVTEQYQVVPLPMASASASGSASAAMPAPIAPPCVIRTADFEARIGAVSGGLQEMRLLGTKYLENGEPMDLAHRTTIDANNQPLPDYAPFRTGFRVDLNADFQVPGDLVVFDVTSGKDPKWGDTCTLRNETPGVVRVERVVHPTERPYELAAETRITNLADGPRKHTFYTELFALQLKSKEGGFLHRPSPNEIFQAACAHDGKVERKDKGALREWFSAYGTTDYVAISTSYVAQAIVPTDNLGAHCSLLAEDRGQKDTDSEQSLFRAMLVYPQKELQTGDSAVYTQTAFIGPKERHILAGAVGGGHHIDQLVDLGMFSFIAKYLVMFLVFVRSVVDSWGVAIILLTVTIRLALLPLTLPQIRSSIAMRRLKPELDELNKKFEGDQQAKMLATSQLYKRHGVNPLSGCLPAIMQMPVWFALYTALQTAIELYHEKFLFWSDLSSPDPRFILPVVLGATMFVQQRVTPMQMDPAQQKIFMYFMPALFTVFMLFLPAGLGIYMLTNSLLGIGQTLAVERYMKSQRPAEVKVTQAQPASTSDTQKKKPRPARELARAPKPPADDEPS